MRAPLVLHPVVPVLHDVVDRNLALAELYECTYDFIRGLIALAALPEAQRPLWIDGCPACQRTVTSNNLIRILARNEIIVHILCHLRPDAQTVLRRIHRGAQSAVAYPSVRTPLHTKLVTFPLHQTAVELVGIRIPCCTPTFRDDLFAIDIYLNITRIIENKVKRCRLTGFYKALINNVGTIKHKALGQILNTTRLSLECQFRLLRRIKLIVQRVLLTHQRLPISIGIGTRQVALYAFLIVKFKDTVQLLVVIWISKASIGISVPQQSIIVTGHNERNTDLGIILEEVLILSQHVQLFRLVLSQTIETARITIEQQVPR